MQEPIKEQFGDGQDNFGQAAAKASEAARQFSEISAAKGTEMAVNSAAASVQAGLEGGSAVANVAAGTAAGGPWGAVLSAAWAMRHTLYKILICICLLFTVIIVLVVALPSIVTESIFGLNGTQPDPNATLESSYTEMAAAVSSAIEAGYDQSLARVEEIILDGGYDYDLSMDALINHAQSTAGYDVAYILAAYSASLQQKDTSVDDMLEKLADVGDIMFPVTYEEKEQERIIPVTYSTYKPVTVTVIKTITVTGYVNNVPSYDYTTESRTYYVPDETLQSEVPVTQTAYKAVTVMLPVYTNGRLTSTRNATYYEENGTETLEPTIEIIKYVECTIHPFDNTVIADAFDIDLSAEYPTFNITYGEAIRNMADALKMTLYGSLGSGESIPITDAELLGIVGSQNCNDTRKLILTTALSLVGKVPYFWGGKSEAGWNDEWNKPKLVKAVGFPEDVGEFYRLEEYEGYSWTAHGRYPTNTPGWWGGAHPFTLLDYSIVHNGEISSYDANRRFIEMFGYKCNLQTDTEVITYIMDYLLRRQGLSLEEAASVIAAPFWSTIQGKDESERQRLSYLRTVFPSLLITGPFSIILGFDGGLMALNDRLKLRSMVVGEKNDKVFIASEEAAIRTMEPEAENIWAPAGGEPVIVTVKEGAY